MKDYIEEWWKIENTVNEYKISQQGSSGVGDGGQVFGTGLLIIVAYDADKGDSSPSYLFISLTILSVK